MKRILLALFVFCICLQSSNCGNETTLYANDYDRSCNEDGDCVVVFVGEMCECNCEYGAINRSAKDRYDEDYDSIECDGSCDDVHIDCMFCDDQTRAVCKDSLCLAEILPR